MLEHYYRINQAAGIQLHLQQDGTATIQAVMISAYKNELTIDQKLIDLGKIADLKKHLPTSCPVALNISGKGVLQKQIEKIDLIDQSNFGKILPNGNIDDFYVQNFISGARSFVSIIRKADADYWLNELKDGGFMSFQLSLGPFPVQNIMTQLNSYSNELIFNGNIIQRNEQSEWTSCRYAESASSPFTVKIDLEGLPEKLVIPYAAAFQLVLVTKLEVVQAEVPVLGEMLKEKLENIRLRVHGVLVMATLFLLLLVNFVLFSWLNSANAGLTSQVSQFAQSTNNIQGVNDEVKKKEGLLQSLGWDGGVNKSALIDQLAALMPPEISWKMVSIDPVDINNSRIQKTLVFYNLRIRVTGLSARIIPVNEWIARMKTKAFFKHVQLESYAFNNELNTGQFTLQIDY